MSLICLISSGTRKCFVRDSGTRERKVEKHSPTIRRGYVLCRVYCALSKIA
jgi:hypothetical protein